MGEFGQRRRSIADEAVLLEDRHRLLESVECSLRRVLPPLEQSLDAQQPRPGDVVVEVVGRRERLVDARVGAQVVSGNQVVDLRFETQESLMGVVQGAGELLHRFHLGLLLDVSSEVVEDARAYSRQLESAEVIVGEFECPVGEVQCGLMRVRVGCLACRHHQMGDCPFRVTAEVEMPAQFCRPQPDLLGVEILDGRACCCVPPLPRAAESGFVSNLLGDHVLEDMGVQVVTGQEKSLGVEFWKGGRRLYESFEHPIAELSAENGGGLEDPLRVRLQPVDT